MSRTFVYTQKTFHIVLICLALLLSKVQAQNIAVIPQPNKVVITENDFFTKVISSAPINAPFLNWQQQINKQNVILDINAKDSTEQYKITINKSQIVITATQNSKVYALQTLRQLQENYGNKIPCCIIDDQPKFNYRGMHLDVCRHFFTVKEVQAYLELLSRYKINKFHWHLTDDQGWRIQIKKYPLLTKIGGTRKQTLIGRQTSEEGNGNYDHKIHQGYYTQEEIKQVINDANNLGITIIPEIEMPGHSKAAIAAYPFLSCSKQKVSVGDRWGVYKEVFCAGNDSTYTFLQNVLSEVMQLFPSNYIHIGGDEVIKTEWMNCSKCKNKMASEGLKDANSLQSYFIQKMEKFVNGKGKKIIGWDEILEGGLAPNATVMSWRGEDGGIAAAQANHDAIMTPGSHCYFDHRQSKNEQEPLNIGGNTHYTKVYNYNPMPSRLSDTTMQKHILGAQANMWTEYISSNNQLQYMLLPRLQALSEVLWTSNKNLQNFQKNLGKDLLSLDAKKINYRIPEPIYLKSHDTIPTSSNEFDWNAINTNATIYNADNKERLNNNFPIPFNKNGYYSINYYLQLPERKSIIYKQTFKKLYK